MKVARIAQALEKIAPPALAAEWDNVGLLIGDPEARTDSLLLCIDLTAPVLEEALAKKARMVMAYHPTIFRPVSRLTASAAPVAYAAARRGVAVYSMHTALDAAPGGTNDALAEAAGLVHTRPLEELAGPKQCKVVVFVPPGDLSPVAAAAFAAGAGRIGNYTDCAFFSHGIGTFRGGEGSHPAIGRTRRHEATEELRLEFVAPLEKLSAVCRAVRKAHSYETPAIDAYPLADLPGGCGMGRIGRLRRPATVRSVIARLKKATGVSAVSVAPASGAGLDAMVKTAACFAGSCDATFRSAIAGGATLLVTGEMRHHYALEAAAAGTTVVSLGHSNSERLVLRCVAKRLKAELPKLKVLLSQRDADPYRPA